MARQNNIDSALSKIYGKSTNPFKHSMFYGKEDSDDFDTYVQYKFEHSDER